MELEGVRVEALLIQETSFIKGLWKEMWVWYRLAENSFPPPTWE